MRVVGVRIDRVMMVMVVMVIMAVRMGMRMGVVMIVVGLQAAHAGAKAVTQLTIRDVRARG